MKIETPSMLRPSGRLVAMCSVLGALIAALGTAWCFAIRETTGTVEYRFGCGCNWVDAERRVFAGAYLLPDGRWHVRVDEDDAVVEAERVIPFLAQRLPDRDFGIVWDIHLGADSAAAWGAMFRMWEDCRLRFKCDAVFDSGRGLATYMKNRALRDRWRSGVSP